MPALQFDDLTVILLVACGFILALQIVFGGTSNPLLHPILLGRQAEPSRVRRSGESAIWHNSSAVNENMLVARPLANVKLFSDVVNAFQEPLKLRIQNLARQLQSHFTADSANDKYVAVYVNDLTEVPTIVAAFAYVPSVKALVVPEVEALELLLPKCKAIIASRKINLPSSENNVKLFYKAATLPEGADSNSVLLKDDISSNDSELASLDGKADDVALCFAAKVNEKWTVINTNHMNLTASIYNIQSLFTTHAPNKVTENDRIASYYSPLTPFGLSIAFSALYLRAPFFVADTTNEAIQEQILFRPTIIFINPTQAKRRAAVLKRAFYQKSRLIGDPAFYFKQAALREGKQNNKTWWDKLHVNSFKKSYHQEDVRALAVFSNGNPNEILTFDEMDNLRITFGCGVVQGLIHPTQGFPLTASHIHDFQAFAWDLKTPYHLGVPTINVIIKLALRQETEEKHQGSLLLQSPCVARNASASEIISKEKQWFDTGYQVEIHPNGTISLIAS